LQVIGFGKTVIAFRKDGRTLRAYSGKSKDFSSMLEFLRKEAPQKLLKREGDD